MEIRTFNNYKSMIDTHKNETQEKINFLFAFTEERLEEQTQEKNIEINNLINLGSGVFMTEEEYIKLKNLSKVHALERKEFLKNKDNLKEAIRFEILDREIVYSYDPRSDLEELYSDLELDVNDQETIKLFDGIYNNIYANYDF